MKKRVRVQKFPLSPYPPCLMMFNKRRKAKSESEGGDDRHFGVLREGSGSVVSVVSVVN